VRFRGQNLKPKTIFPFLLNKMNYQFHPVADLFPLMNDGELDSLAENIFLFGQRESVLLFEGMVVVGRNTVLACERKDIEPKVADFRGGEREVVSFVIRMNLRRASLSESQRAMIAARLVEMRPEDLAELASGETRLSPEDAAAKLLNVSRSHIEHARLVLEKGVMEIVEKTDDGETSLLEAVKLVKVSKCKQMRMQQRGRDKKRKLAEQRVIEITASEDKTCLLCRKENDLTQEDLIRHLIELRRRFPKYARYFSPILEEFQDEQISGDVRSAYDKILAAIDLGIQEPGQIYAKTKLEKDMFDAGVSYLIEFGAIEAVEQGGKPEAARGQRKTLLRRKFKLVKDSKPESSNSRQQVTETNRRAFRSAERRLANG
jgi:hypothetical protein